MAYRLWCCVVCGKKSERPSQRHGAGAWRKVPGVGDLCPQHSAERYRRLGSDLAPPAGPPAGVTASAPWAQARSWEDARRLQRIKAPPAPPRPPKPRPSQVKPKPTVWPGEAPVARPPGAQPTRTMGLRAEAAILEHPDWTNRAVAAALGGANVTTVARARARLRERGDLPPAPPTIRELVRRELAADPSRSNVELGKLLGCSDAAVSKERKRLREATDPSSAASPAAK